MAENLANAIEENAAGPKKASGDAVITQTFLQAEKDAATLLLAGGYGSDHTPWAALWHNLAQARLSRDTALSDAPPLHLGGDRRGGDARRFRWHPVHRCPAGRRGAPVA